MNIKIEYEWMIPDCIDEFSSTKHFAHLEFDKLVKANPNLKFKLTDYDSDGATLFLCCIVEGDVELIMDIKGGFYIPFDNIDDIGEYLVK
mgnify:CR=1 FL=1